jgi:hypothetical protein
VTGTRLGFALALLTSGLASTPALAGEPTKLSDKEFDRLSRQLQVKSQTWASIPWKTSVTEARRLAARENKPIFFNVNTGNCLGFT